MKSKSIAMAALVSLLSAGVLRADVKLPAIFGDHMVLQRGQKVPFWGTADAGEEVTVSIGDAKSSTKADADGKWKLMLNSLKASDQPTEVTVAGKNTISIKNVLVGDVWVASGQSNMQFALGEAHNASVEIPKAKHPNIRLFSVTRTATLNPQSDCTGRWDVCSPDSARGFSAAGYFFALDVQETQKVPVGMIGTYWGGTPAQAWTSIEALANQPATKGFAESFSRTKSDLPALEEKYKKELLPAYEAAIKKWESEVGEEYNKLVKTWNEEVAKAKAEGKAAPPKPTPPKPAPKKPAAPGSNPNMPSTLYNGMIAPIIPYAIKGAIWYQGESNAGQPMQYRTLFPTMITDWRTRWGQGDFTFVWVQLANYKARNEEPIQASGGWPGLREAQSMTLKLPNTGQAVTIDIGDDSNIHPKNKLDVGRRLALAARHVAYGEDIVFSGPTYDAVKVDGDKIRVTFKNTGGGLEIGTPPPVRLNQPAAVPASELIGFSIAGEDKKFVWAKATIEGDSVIVSSPDVKNPVAVRYAWAENPACNLYNKEKLPASPFRTDDWNDAAAEKK